MFAPSSTTHPYFRDPKEHYMNVKKQAAQDAYEYALADMFFGEGAGTRRKLITNAVAWNTERVTGYKEAFDEALSKINFAEITKEVKERKRIDRIHTASKNLKALGRGDLRGASTVVVIVASGVWLAHETGTDKLILEDLKKKQKKLKAKYAAYKLRRPH
jgi:hypothetical protein